MKIFLREFIVAAKQTPRLYFAIFFGAVRGIKAELAALEKINARSNLDHA